MIAPQQGLFVGISRLGSKLPGDAAARRALLVPPPSRLAPAASAERQAPQAESSAENGAEPAPSKRGDSAISEAPAEGSVAGAAFAAADELALEEDRRAREANAAYRRGGAKPKDSGQTGQLLDLKT